MYLLNFNFDLIFIGLAVVSITILGFVVYLNDKRSLINKSFLFFSFLTVVYSIVNYFSYQIKDIHITLWLLRFTIFFALWHAFSFFHLFYSFSLDKSKPHFSKKYKYILFPVTVFVSALILTPLVFSRIEVLGSVNAAAKAKAGPGILLFIVLVIILVGGAIFLLTKKTIKSTGLLKNQFKFISFGAYITFFLLITFNLILPAVFGNVRFVPYAPVFIFPFIAFTAYAIIKYKLFNVRVIATELITFALWIFILVRTLISNSPQEAFINGLLFIITVVVGILLMRSVIKEVRQKDEIAKMAEDVRRAYETEKKAKEDINRAYDVELKAKEELEKLDKIKNQFLAQTQHDLRTPLGIIRDYCDLLSDGTFGKQPKKAIDVIKRIQIVAENKIKDVNNFLDTTQFQLGKKVVALKPGIDLDMIMDEIVADLGPVAKAKGISLTLKKPEKIFLIEADREKLKAAIFNIVDNSIKYTLKGGVTVELKNHDTVKIEVSDTGIGIPADKLNTLFDMAFQRSESAKAASPTGRGIGLYLSSQIIKAHNGKVWVDSPGEGKGSKFHVELPIKESAS